MQQHHQTAGQVLLLAQEYHLLGSCHTPLNMTISLWKMINRHGASTLPVPQWNWANLIHPKPRLPNQRFPSHTASWNSLPLPLNMRPSFRYSVIKIDGSNSPQRSHRLCYIREGKGTESKARKKQPPSDQNTKKKKKGTESPLPALLLRAWTKDRHCPTIILSLLCIYFFLWVELYKHKSPRTLHHSS